MGAPFDRRLIPARADLAAAHLMGKVEAARFVEGRAVQVARGLVSLRRSPSDEGSLETQLLYGERFTVYEEQNGWAWGQAALDGYVGYAEADGLSAELSAPTHCVTALGSPRLPFPDVKSPARDMLPMNAKVALAGETGRFARLRDGGHVFAGHLAPLERHEADWVAQAERFLGVPYLWGGKSAAGMDCSGLIQTALEAGGIAAPRDTDMMQAGLGTAVDVSLGLTDLRRGNLIFWRGHMGVMLDGVRLLHANVFAMQVAIENLTEAAARIAPVEGAIRAVHRL